MNEGEIHNIFKLAYKTQTHKGGSKMNPENKTHKPNIKYHSNFKWVIKTHIMKHLERNELVWLYQKSCIWGTQTQLLQRYNDVFEAITEGIIIDTIYLDFVKAFNKVDQNILLKEIGHKIKGKVSL